jgi:hypothetical protein
LPVRASVVPPLSIAPQSVELGSIRPGAKLKGQVVVRGDQPFEITDVQFGDARFTAPLPMGEKKAHLLQFEFDAGDAEGAFKRTLIVSTTLPGTPAAEATVTGNVTR